MLNREEGYPVAIVCDVLSLPRSTYYYVANEPDEQHLHEAIEAVIREFPTYGSRRVARQLQRSPDHLMINRKRVQRLMRSMSLQQPQKRRKYRTTDSRHSYPRYPNYVQGLEVAFPEHVWVSDTLAPYAVQVSRTSGCRARSPFWRSSPWHWPPGQVWTSTRAAFGAGS